VGGWVQNAEYSQLDHYVRDSGYWPGSASYGGAWPDMDIPRPVPALLRHLHAVITTGQRWNPAVAAGGRPSQTLIAA